MRGETPGPLHHGESCGAGVQCRGAAPRAPPQCHPACRSRGRWRRRWRQHGRGRTRCPQARSNGDTGDSRDEQEDEARCFNDTGGTRAEQEDEAVGYLVWRRRRTRAPSRRFSERNWMLGYRRSNTAALPSRMTTYRICISITSTCNDNLISNDTLHASGGGELSRAQ